MKRNIILCILFIFFVINLKATEKEFTVQGEYDRLKLNENDSVYVITTKITRYAEIKQKLDSQNDAKAVKYIKIIRVGNLIGGIGSAIMPLGILPGVIVMSIGYGLAGGNNNKWNSEVMSPSEYKDFIKQYNEFLLKDIERPDRRIINVSNGAVTYETYVNSSEKKIIVDKKADEPSVKKSNENIDETKNILNEAKNWPLEVKDEFKDNKNNWFTGNKDSDFGSQSVKIQNGVYHWEMKANKSSHYWHTINFTTNDTFYLSAKVNKIYGFGNYGLCFLNGDGSNNRQSLYSFYTYKNIICQKLHTELII